MYRIARCIYLVFVFAIISSYGNQMVQWLLLPAQWTRIVISTTSQDTAQHFPLLKDNELLQKVRAINKSNSKLSNGTCNSTILNSAVNKNIMYSNTISLRQIIAFILSIMQRMASNIAFSMGRKIQEIQFYLLDGICPPLHFLWISMATTMLIILKCANCFLKSKLQNTFDMFRKPLLQEMENIKRDTSKLANVLRENNEKLSSIILKNDSKQNGVCDVPKLLIRNNASHFRAVLKRKFRVKYISKPQRQDVHVQNHRIFHIKHTGSQTENQNINNKSTENMENNTTPIVKCKSIRDKISQLYKERQSQTRAVSSDSHLRQRIWIGGKWYLEDVNELREAYSSPVFASETCTRVNRFSTNKSNPRNLLISPSPPADKIFTSTPTSADNTPSFSKFVKQMERRYHEGYDKQRVQSNLQQNTKVSAYPTLISHDSFLQISSPVNKKSTFTYPCSPPKSCTSNSPDRSTPPVQIPAGCYRISSINDFFNFNSMINGPRDITEKPKESRDFPYIRTKRYYDIEKQRKFEENKLRSFHNTRIENSHIYRDIDTSQFYSQSRKMEEDHTSRRRKSILKRVQSSPQACTVKHVTLNL